MTMQRLCHRRINTGLLACACLIWCTASRAESPAHDYPTQARVEYVNDCIATNDGLMQNLYKCSCAIDRLAEKLSYEEFVEASTYSRYSSLPGEGGAIFRDSEQAKKLAKLFRDAEAEAHRACGLASDSGA